MKNINSAMSAEPVDYYMSRYSGEETDSLLDKVAAGEAGGGGVSSFNGRSGVVIPQAGDYTAEMVGAPSMLDKGKAGGFPPLDNNTRIPMEYLYEEAVGTRGPAGKDGKDGKDFEILGYFDTFPELELAVPSPQPGDSYGVGITAPYDIYTWDGIGQKWKNNGPLSAGNKIDKVPGATAGNLPTLTADGQLQDSGNKPGDFFASYGHWGQLIPKTSYNTSKPEWIRLCTISKIGGSAPVVATLFVGHNYSGGGPGVATLQVYCDPYAPRIVVSGHSFLPTYVTFGDFRLVMSEDFRTYHVDLFYDKGTRNNLGLSGFCAAVRPEIDVEISEVLQSTPEELTSTDKVLCYAEWSDPPMLLGVEYRTTERYNGKPVYQKLVDIGNLPNNTFKTVSHGSTNVDAVVSASGNAGTYAIPSEGFGVDGSYIRLFAGPEYIIVYTNADRSTLTGKVVIKCTKTTD